MKRVSRSSPQLSKNFKQQVTRFMMSSYTLSLPTLTTLVCIAVAVVSFIVPNSQVSPLTRALKTAQAQSLLTPPHLELATIYTSLGNIDAAKTELTLVQELSASRNLDTNVLGETSQQQLLAERIQKHEAQAQTELLFWQEVVRLYPDFRDAWVRLLYTAYNLQQTDEVTEYLKVVYQLDPNFTELPEELRLLSE